jgi:DNA-binding beta-propeller fold protein YncE
MRLLQAAGLTLGMCLHLPITERAVAVPLFGTTFSGLDGSVLYDIDPQTGTATDPRATGQQFLVGIEFDENQQLYGLSNSASPVHPNTLFRIDPDTGASQVIGFTGLQGLTEGDLAFDHSTNRLYGLYDLRDTGERKLFTLDTETGQASVLPGTLSGDPSAAAFSLDGTLYALDTALQRLLTVDKTTGNVMTSLPLSTPLGSVAGMDVHPLTGVFYVADGGGGGTNRLYHLDVNTGQLQEIGGLDVGAGLAGLAFLPEPSTLLLLTAGGLMLHRRRRLRCWH